EGPAGRNANDAPPAWPRGCCASRATDRPPNGREWHDPRLLHVFRGWRRHQRSGLGSARERWTAASDGSAAAIADAEPAPVLALQVLECTGCDKSFRETRAGSRRPVSAAKGACRLRDRRCGRDQTKRAKKQKTDRQDAQLLLKLLLEENFPRSGYPI